MKLLYEETLGGLSIQRCYGLDGSVVVPESINGLPVKELAGYVLSETVRGRDKPPAEFAGEPEIKGGQVEELVLPVSLERVGAYGFYNCYGLRTMAFHSTTLDWGAGVFTGCTGIKRLDIRVHEGSRSCLKEILTELRQTLVVDYRDEQGRMLAKLIFPEYFEESVENTPARIITREMHGCGHMYRYCFEETRFKVGEYDRLFRQVQIQESEALAVRLALYRLFWPWGLSGDAGNVYWEYVKNHVKAAAMGLLEREETEILFWLARERRMDEMALEEMVTAAAQMEDAQSAAALMDTKYRRFGAAKAVKRSFEL